MSATDHELTLITRLRRLRRIRDRVAARLAQARDISAALAAEVAATPERAACAPWRACVGSVYREAQSSTRSAYLFSAGGGTGLMLSVASEGESWNADLGERCLRAWCVVDLRGARMNRFSRLLEDGIRAAVEG